MNDSEKTTVLNIDGSVLGTFAKTYGGAAFGTMSLLLIWYAIVAPELAARKIDYEEQKAVVTQMKEIATTMERTSIVLERAVSAVTRLEENARNNSKTDG